MPSADRFGGVVVGGWLLSDEPTVGARSMGCEPFPCFASPAVAEPSEERLADRPDFDVLVAALDTEITRELASDDPCTVAWGAWHAGERRRKTLAPALSAVIGHANGFLGDFATRSRPTQHPAAELAWFEAGWALLDALLLVDSGVTDWRLLEPWWHPRFCARPQLLVLASRDPRASADFLLAKSVDRDQLQRDEWSAWCAVLLASGDPRVVPELLRTMKVPVEITVHDGDPDESRGIGCGTGYLPAIAGFPPLPSCAITDFTFRTEPYRCFTTRPFALYWDREDPWPNAGITTHFSSAYHNRDPSTAALACLEAALGLPDELMALDPTSGDPDRAEIEWIDVDTTGARVRALHDEGLARWRRLVAAAVAKGAITAADGAALGSPFECSLHDQRRDKTIPLPEFDFSK